MLGVPVVVALFTVPLPSSPANWPEVDEELDDVRELCVAAAFVIIGVTASAGAGFEG